jgi:hypothetical protein
MSLAGQRVLPLRQIGFSLPFGISHTIVTWFTGKFFNAKIAFTKCTFGKYGENINTLGAMITLFSWLIGRSFRPIYIFLKYCSYNLILP